MIDVDEISERHAAVMERIAAAATRSGRSPADITLIAVTKTWPAELVIAAHAAGLTHFGENRLEELAAKRPAVEAALGPGSGITWHLIGPVQSRKADLAAAHADVLHALERDKIARRLATERPAGRPLPCFIEVNVSGEAGKHGLDAARWETDATQITNLRKMISDTAARPGLQAVGLMTMAPWDVAPDVIRSVFRRTRELAGRLGDLFPQPGGALLSMGMTDDFEIAVEEGATHVRVGRALFGERNR